MVSGSREETSAIPEEAAQVYVEKSRRTVQSGVVVEAMARVSVCPKAESEKLTSLVHQSAR